jgi:hypothetical protein
MLGSSGWYQAGSAVGVTVGVWVGLAGNVNVAVGVAVDKDVDVSVGTGVTADPQAARSKRNIRKTKRAGREDANGTFISILNILAIRLFA